MTKAGNTDCVFCACGAQWHGEVIARAADIIAAHRQRWDSHIGGCGDITHGAYIKQFRCLCASCAAERSARWRMKRGARARAK